MATDNKYDRQIRLWGSEGQKKLSEASILLINATAAGTEALKNLILPGVGFVTVLDDKLIEERDLGNNFFLTQDEIGKSRAETTLNHLLELNEDVQGSFLHEAPEKYISNKDESFFKQFKLVIAWDVSDAEIVNLSEISDQINISMIFLRSYGMIGYLRLYRREHTCMQAKPADVELDDLRLAAPFEELEKYWLDFETEHLDSLEHSHIPYVVILIKALHKWKEAHESNLPKTFKEKDEFKDIIKGMAREYGAEVNFGEAVDKAFKAFNYEPVPPEIQQILDDEKAESKEYHSNFWLYVSALKQFVLENGCLPVNGKLPDMTATSDFYITLQKIYQKKAEEDREKFFKIIQQQIEEKGLMEFSLDPEEIKTFCENWR
jgi:NEDD8-activating enzyme E1 regulatory subunit